MKKNLSVKNFGCIIMASGLGKRFGGNKLMTDFDGKPLIQWILEATGDIFSKRVVVTRHKEVAQLCMEMEVEVVLHDLPDRNDTIRLGLEWIGDEVEGCMICQGDQPLLSRNSIIAMLEEAEKVKGVIWRAAYEDVAASPVLFPKWTFDELLHLPKGKGGRVVIGKYPEQVRLLMVQHPWELQDVDSPEDMERMKTLVM